MKIVTWNCNGALRKKWVHLQKLEADIYVIQECENPKLLVKGDFYEWSENHLWIGDTKNKGLGIIANPKVQIQALPWIDIFETHRVKHFLPCRINNNFNLLGVWTHQNNSPNFGYIGQFWKYLQVNKFKLGDCLIAGDLNSNVKWDEWDRWWNHSDVVLALEKLGIESLYHKVTGENQGKETGSTFYLHRRPERPYHIDYVFGSEIFSNNIRKLEIGIFEEWIKISDHMPMSVEFGEDIWM